MVRISAEHGAKMVRCSLRTVQEWKMGSSCNSHGMEVLPVAHEMYVVQCVAFSINSGDEF